MFRTICATIARRMRATYLDTQLSRFSMANDHPILATHPPDLCPVSGKRIAPMRWNRPGCRGSISKVSALL